MKNHTLGLVLVVLLALAAGLGSFWYFKPGHRTRSAPQSLGLSIPGDPADGLPLVEALEDRLAALEAGSPHPLFTQHLKSLEALVWTVWGRLSLTGPQGGGAWDPVKFTYLRSLFHAFEEGRPATRWESYLEGGYPLVRGFGSSRDQTVQYYTLTLPKGWKPADNQVYPLFFELHGRDNPDPLAVPAAYYENSGPDSKEYRNSTTYAMRDRTGFHVMPFDRGNVGYRDIGESDVFDALADVQGQFQTDPDRTYLYGFSMGGGGAVFIARETPDLWAGVASLSSEDYLTPAQAGNLAIVPVYLWAGTEDQVGFHRGKPAEVLEALRSALVKAGGEVRSWTSQGTGHVYMPEVQQDSIGWLKAHVRKRPRHFSFTVDDPWHPGIWGIAVQKDNHSAEPARFDCWVDGSKVVVRTSGASGVSVSLGALGLGFAQGQVVTLVVDGKGVFQGPVSDKPVEVGQFVSFFSRFVRHR